MFNEPIDIEKKTQIIGWLWWNESNWWFVIRCMMTLITIITFCYSFAWHAIPLVDNVYNDTNCCAQFYGLYLTHWGLVSELIYFLLILYLHGQTLYNHSFNIDTCYNYIIWKMMKAFYIIGLNITFIVGILYWPLFYNGPTEPSYLTLQILQHTITPILIFIEYFINLNQLKYAWSIIVTGITGILYAILLIFHWLFNGQTEKGRAPIYDTIDFDNDPVTASIIVCSVAIIFPVIAILFVRFDICIMRNFDDQKIDTKPPKPTEQELNQIVDL